MTRVQTPNLTSYDFVKAAALLLMIADHIGYFFFPDDMWWRALGRLSAPIWLFLIGYARSRDLSWQLWGGALVLMAVNFICGIGIFPVYILGSMLLFRLIIDPVMNFLKKDERSLYPVTLVVLALTLITSSLFEYGMEGFIFVMAGYLSRNRLEMGFSHNKLTVFLLVVAFAHYLASTMMFFSSFTLYQEIFIGLAMVGIMLGLGEFRPAEYPRLTGTLPRTATWLLQFFGRWSLEIYVVHLAALHLYALLSGAPGYNLFYFRFW